MTARSDGSKSQFGRPTKLTPDLRDLIASFCRDRNTYDVAARVVGVNRSTFFDWLRRGRTARVRLNAGEHVSVKDKSFIDFVEAIETARADAEASALQVVRDSILIKRDLKAAEWYLERAHPERWSRYATERSPSSASLMQLEDRAERLPQIKDALEALSPAERVELLDSMTPSETDTTCVRNDAENLVGQEVTFRGSAELDDRAFRRIHANLVAAQRIKAAQRTDETTQATTNISQRAVVAGREDHAGFLAIELDDGSETSIWSTELPSPIARYRAACECGWRADAPTPDGLDGAYPDDMTFSVLMLTWEVHVAKEISGTSRLSGVAGVQTALAADCSAAFCAAGLVA